MQDKEKDDEFFSKTSIYIEKGFPSDFCLFIEGFNAKKAPEIYFPFLKSFFAKNLAPKSEKTVTSCINHQKPRNEIL